MENISLLIGSLDTNSPIESFNMLFWYSIGMIVWLQIVIDFIFENFTFDVQCRDFLICQWMKKCIQKMFDYGPCVQFLPPANEVWGKVMFSQVFVCPQGDMW